MQAYKLKGKIDLAGNLVITESVNLPPGDVEVIVLTVLTAIPSSELVAETPKRKSRVKAFEGLFENAPPVPPDFDAEDARWSGLKEKYHL